MGLNVLALALAISSCAFINAVGGAEQEATLIAVDNSGYMINSDHRPSRLQCQYECVNLVCTVKTQHPENTVGLLTMGCQSDDDQPEIHVTPGTNQQLGPILIAMSKVNKQIGGSGANRVRFKKSMELAYLSLKHRIHKHQRPRIVAFVGSPIIGEDMREIVKCAKTLRKNNVAVDLISFGESPRVNKEILEAFMQGVNKDGTSHLLSLPAEACTAGGLSDALFSSPILNHAPPPGTAPESGERGPAVGGGREADAGAFAEFGGINPDLDPELAMALKMSAQEEAERREKQKKLEFEALTRSCSSSAPESTAPNESTAPLPIPLDQHAGQPDEDHELKDNDVGEQDQEGEEDEEEDQDAELQRALEMSLKDALPPQ